MNPAQLRKLGIALGALLLLWLGLVLIRRLRSDQPTTMVVSKVNQAEVDTLVIDRKEDPVRLTRKGAGWLVNGLAASTSAVEDLLNALADTAAHGELVAENASSHERLGVDSTNGKRVTAKKGGTTLFTYLVGKRGSNWESGYLRRPGENPVYLLKGRLVELAERRIDDWRDKRIAAALPDSVTEVEITRGKKSYLLKKSDKTWTFTDGGATDSTGVASLLNQFKTLDGSAFATTAQADSTDFAKPERQVRLRGSGGRPLFSLAMDSTLGGFWVRRDSLPTVYKLDSWRADQLTPIDSTLRKKSAPK